MRDINPYASPREASSAPVDAARVVRTSTGPLTWTIRQVLARSWRAYRTNWFALSIANFVQIVVLFVFDYGVKWILLLMCLVGMIALGIGLVVALAIYNAMVDFVYLRESGTDVE